MTHCACIDWARMEGEWGGEHHPRCPNGSEPMRQKIGTAEVIAVNGQPPSRKVRRKQPLTDTAWGASCAVGWAVELRLGCAVVSEANRRGHWAKAHRRATDQKNALHAAWLCSPLVGWSGWGVPVAVTLTHHGPRIDGHDNLPRAFKAIVDALCERLGCDDGDGTVEWKYRQEPSGPGVTVRIESRLQPPHTRILEAK